MIIGLDFETTGLDVDTLSILEIALVLYDDDLAELDSYTSVVYCPESVLATCNPFVKEMHKGSGLWQSAAEGQSLAAVELDLKRLFDKWERHGPLRRMPLMGNSVHFDRAILRRFFRDQHDRLHHRNIDASTVNELARRWAPDMYPDGYMTHRALDDVRESARTLREYRKTWLTVSPIARLRILKSRISDAVRRLF